MKIKILIGAIVLVLSGCAPRDHTHEPREDEPVEWEDSCGPDGDAEECIVAAKGKSATCEQAYRAALDNRRIVNELWDREKSGDPASCSRFAAEVGSLSDAVDTCRTECGLPSLCPSKSGIPQRCRE